MDFSSKSPKKEFNKDIASKIEIPKYRDKDLKKDVDKPNLKPDNNPKNKTEPRQIDPKKELKHKILHQKLDPKAPPRHSIEPRQIETKKEPKHKIQHRKINPKAKPKNKIRGPNFPPKDKTNEKMSGIGIKFNNLMDPKIQNIFRKYHNEIGKYPNYGRNLKKDFIKWVKDNEKNPDSSNKIKEIQLNQEILKFLKDKIKNTDETQYKIKKLTEDIGINVSHGTIKKISLEHVYNNDPEKYEKRFLSEKYKGVLAKKKK